MEPSLSRTARLAGLLESSLERSVVIGIRGMFVTGIILIGYLLIGGLLVFAGSPWAPRVFLSLNSDPYFYATMAIISIFIVQATGSLILYNFLTGVEDQRSQFVILMSYIGLGFGGAALRFTLPQSIDFILNMI